MSVETSSRVRHAALTLHAMAAHDAAWLLQQLPAIEAAELQSLLEELRSLGIPSDPGLVDELRKGAEAPGQPAPANMGAAGTDGLPLEALIDELDAAHADRLLPILKPEPALLLALLLSMKSWAWSDSLLASLETHRRLSLRQQTGGFAHAGAGQLQLALLRRLLQRYRDAGACVSPQNPAAARDGGFARWWRERRRFWSGIVAPMRSFK
jgi:hypothetical protein